MRKLIGTHILVIPPVGRTYYLRLCLALSISSLATLSASVAYGGGLEVLYQTVGGGAFASGAGMPSMLALLVWGVPALVLCYLFSDFFREGLSHAASLFTRTSRRGVWLGWRVVQLSGFIVAYTLLSSVLSALIACAVGVFDGLTPSPYTVASLLLQAAGLNALMLLVLLLLLNVTSVRVNPVACSATVFAIYVVSLLICTSLSPGAATLWVSWLPSAQGIFAFHEASLVFVSAQGAIKGFTLWHSYVYLLVLALIEIGACGVYLKRLELY